MDDRIQILLNSKKNIESINKNTFGKIELDGNRMYFNELDITKIVSASDIYYQEREESEDYRIYGRIEYLSLLNGIKTDYSDLNDLFIKTGTTTNFQTIYNSFEFYLVKPSTKFLNISGTTKWVRQMEVVSTPSNFDIFSAGFTNNVYGDEVYSFIVNNSINISGYLDGLGMPITDLYLYPKYITNRDCVGYERLYGTTWSGLTGTTTFMNSTSSEPAELKIGDLIIGDVIDYNLNEFSQTVYDNQKYTIETYFTGGTGTTMFWTYNPLIPIKLRYFSSNLNKASKLSTSYDQLERIPDYAIKIYNEDNYIWRNILQQGTFDPITNVGVDYPFVNKKRYVFIASTIDIVPNMSDTVTFNTLKDIKYGIPESEKTSPTTDVNDIGKPCQ